mmetsp:Transcript_12274/g.45487  ORF Transcript_12274/g.45487 Transcript_12274/m.45487 type:complete len:359 (+) Transcript_12274:1402-2478(+)
MVRWKRPTGRCIRRRSIHRRHRRRLRSSRGSGALLPHQGADGCLSLQVFFRGCIRRGAIVPPKLLLGWLAALLLRGALASARAPCRAHLGRGAPPSLAARPIAALPLHVLRELQLLLQIRPQPVGHGLDILALIRRKALQALHELLDSTGVEREEAHQLIHHDDSRSNIDVRVAVQTVGHHLHDLVVHAINDRAKRRLSERLPIPLQAGQGRSVLEGLRVRLPEHQLAQIVPQEEADIRGLHLRDRVEHTHGQLAHPLDVLKRREMLHPQLMEHEEELGAVESVLWHERRPCVNARLQKRRDGPANGVVVVRVACLEPAWQVVFQQTPNGLDLLHVSGILRFELFQRLPALLLQLGGI